MENVCVNFSSVMSLVSMLESVWNSYRNRGTEYTYIHMYNSQIKKKCS